MQQPKPTTCPYCGKSAPLIFKGVQSFCAACDRPRLPFSAPIVNVSGKPAKVGGSIAKFVGWAVLFFGVSIAIATAALFQSLFPSGIFGWGLGIAILLITLFAGVSLLWGGKALREQGDVSEKNSLMSALGAYASQRNGRVIAREAASVLNLDPQHVETLLLDMAKTKPDEVTMDVDDNGNFVFTLGRYLPPMRIDPQAPSVDPNGEWTPPNEMQSRRRNSI